MMHMQVQISADLLESQAYDLKPDMRPSLMVEPLRIFIASVWLSPFILIKLYHELF